MANLDLTDIIETYIRRIVLLLGDRENRKYTVD